jgi:hypothetical protein
MAQLSFLSASSSDATRSGAILVPAGKLSRVVPASEIPIRTQLYDFKNASAGGNPGNAFSVTAGTAYEECSTRAPTSIQQCLARFVRRRLEPIPTRVNVPSNLPGISPSELSVADICRRPSVVVTDGMKGQRAVVSQPARLGLYKVRACEVP